MKKIRLIALLFSVLLLSALAVQAQNSLGRLSGTVRDQAGAVAGRVPPAASTVVARFELGPDEYAGAWGWLFGTWLPGSGYQPDGAVPYEVYLGEPGPRGTHLVELCVPVKPR